jgi:hypothetical protein
LSFLDLFLRFLEAVLDFQLIWSATRLVYDAAVTLFHAPLPGRGASAAIVVGEFVSTLSNILARLFPV